MSKFERISDHIWIMHAEHETDRPILAAVVGSKRTLLMDAGNSMKHADLFREELKRQGLRLPDMLVLTHWHWDHTFGMSGWDLPSISHAKTAESLRSLPKHDWSDESIQRLVDEQILSEDTFRDMRSEYGNERKIEIVIPDILFQDQINIDLGDVTVEVKHVGGRHAIDSCYVYIKEDKVLFLGDALGPSVYGGPRSYNSSDFMRLVDVCLEYDAGVLVESHGEPMNREDFLKDVEPWMKLAQLVELHGEDKERIASNLTTYLEVEALPEHFQNGIEWFINGITK